MGSAAICLPSQAWGPGESGERVLVGRAGRGGSHREAEHICIYTWGDSKKSQKIERREAEQLKAENQQVSEESHWISLILVSIINPK